MLSSLSVTASGEEQTAGLASTPCDRFPGCPAGGSEPRPDEEDDWLRVVEVVLPEPME